ncbi:hypothetical protein KEM48_014309 [Puccinia striiformis f. sp. tritici PST-130]|nr:hypothetical protein KEM48_014309 [Puccinia striiformis f. sp. tritici PST-130]
MDSVNSKKRKSMSNGTDKSATTRTRARVEENGKTKDEPVDVDNALLGIPPDDHGSLGVRLQLGPAIVRPNRPR